MFQAPEKLEPWTGTLDCTKPRDRCAQINPWTTNRLQGSEDCLYLNVHVPAKTFQNGGRLPVMAFVHGGRILFGSASSYRPDYFLNEDVVFVTIGHRLHILGFLCLNTSEVPGNAGLKDIVMALNWIKCNIRSFNGDQNNVTIFGESSGSSLCSTLMFSPMNNNLIHKIIHESGSLLSDNFMVPGDQIHKAKKVCKALGEDLNDIDDIYTFLKGVSTEELVKAVIDVEWSNSQTIPASEFQPVVECFSDGAYMYEDPRMKLKRGNFAKIPVLIGYNSNESIAFVMLDSEGKLVNVDYPTNEARIKDYKQFIPLSIDVNTNTAKILAEDMKEFYKDEQNPVQLYSNVLSDHVFVSATHLYVDDLVNNGADVYLYKFDYMGSLNSSIVEMLGLRGAMHSDHLRYQFFNERNWVRMNDTDKKIARVFANGWTTFAKYGIPQINIDGITKWPPVTADARPCLLINKSLSIVQFPDENGAKFWRTQFGKHRKRLAKL